MGKDYVKIADRERDVNKRLDSIEKHLDTMSKAVKDCLSYGRGFNSGVKWTLDNLEKDEIIEKIKDEWYYQINNKPLVQKSRFELGVYTHRSWEFNIMEIESLYIKLSPLL